MNVVTTERKGTRPVSARRRRGMSRRMHAAQAEDDTKTTLLVACTNIRIEPAPPSPTEVHLNEDKLFVQLSNKKCGDRVR
jgi:hypothetical protein